MPWWGWLMIAIVLGIWIGVVIFFVVYAKPYYSAKGLPITRRRVNRIILAIVIFPILASGCLDMLDEEYLFREAAEE